MLTQDPVKSLSIQILLFSLKIVYLLLWTFYLIPIPKAAWEAHTLYISKSTCRLGRKLAFWAQKRLWVLVLLGNIFKNPPYPYQIVHRITYKIMTTTTTTPSPIDYRDKFPYILHTYILHTCCMMYDVTCPIRNTCNLL
jgi:hypothetical protein